MNSVCLAVLNYNGIHHLESLLPSLEAACRESPVPAFAVVLDNQSSQGDVEWVMRRHPDVKCIVAKNNDFLFSYNWLAENRTEEILIILNNDLKLRPNFIAPLLRHFVFDDVFAVSATSRDWDDRMFTCGPARLKSHHGMYYWDYERERQELCHTLFCSGGFMAVDRRKFLELGGFNRLFQPAYGEDLDLGFRAWCKGWRCLFEPASVVLHRENGSIGDGADGCAARLMLRANLLFQWSSLPTAAPWAERSAFFWLTVWRKLSKGEAWWLRVWLETWFEWRRLRKEYHQLKTSETELNRILAAIGRPARTPLK